MLDSSDASTNLIQLLRLRVEDKPEVLQWLDKTTLRVEDKPEVLQWLDKTTHKHTAPENQNEMLKLISHSVLRRILKVLIELAIPCCDG